MGQLEYSFCTVVYEAQNTLYTEPDTLHERAHTNINGATNEELPAGSGQKQFRNERVWLKLLVEKNR